MTGVDRLNRLNRDDVLKRSWRLERSVSVTSRPVMALSFYLLFLPVLSQ